MLMFQKTSLHMRNVSCKKKFIWNSSCSSLPWVHLLYKWPPIFDSKRQGEKKELKNCWSDKKWGYCHDSKYNSCELSISVYCYIYWRILSMNIKGSIFIWTIDTEHVGNALPSYRFARLSKILYKDKVPWVRASISWILCKT